MNQTKRSGSGVFLMEMIMVVGFFLICAGICIQVFLKADSMSRFAKEKNQAVLAAESLVERYRAEGEEGLAGISNQLACYDQDWNLIEPSGAEDREFLKLVCYDARLRIDSPENGPQELTVLVERGPAHPRRTEGTGGTDSVVLFELTAAGKISN